MSWCRGINVLEGKNLGIFLHDSSGNLSGDYLVKDGGRRFISLASQPYSTPSIPVLPSRETTHDLDAS
jgi:hypothetical protein